MVMVFARAVPGVGNEAASASATRSTAAAINHGSKPASRS